MRIGIFGGVFNPPHVGHLAVAEMARDFLNLDIVYWVPSGRPPHKTVADDVSAALRLKLVDAAIERNRFFRVWRDEIESSAVSYSIDTVKRISAAHPGAKLHFLLGTDAYASLPSWKSINELIGMVHFVIYPRGKEKAPRLPGDRATFLDAHNVDLSSSDVREKLRLCGSVRYLVPDAVLRLVDDHALYAAEISERLRAHLDAVETAAVHLAERWGLPEWAARLAARYHDSCKALSAGECMKILEKHGEAVPVEEQTSAALLHGRVAARRVAMIAANRGEECGTWDSIANAVRYHTTGRGGMDPIEETLMIADRFGKDWHELREIPADRNEAMKFVLRRKLEILERKKLAPHADMRDAMMRYGVGAR